MATTSETPRITTGDTTTKQQAFVSLITTTSNPLVQDLLLAAFKA